jgi:hypothetical protein
LFTQVINMNDASMIAAWTAWTDAKSETAARVVAARLLEALNHPVGDEKFERYHKTGGWSYTFQTRVNEGTRNDCVVAALALGMRVGYSWILSGDIVHGLVGWSSAARIAGITNLQWQLVDEETPKSE